MTRAATIERFRFRTEMRKSERTAEIYSSAVEILDAYLTRVDDRRPFEDLDPDTIDIFFHAFAKGRGGYEPHSPSYVNQIYRSLRQFYKWHSAGGPHPEYPDPMLKVEPRKEGELRFEGKVLTDADLRRVLATVEHARDYKAVRDHAIFRLLMSGLRLGEVLSMTLEGIDLRALEVAVVGKADENGVRMRTIGIGKATALALDDFLAARARHRLAHRRELWLGERGPLSDSGVEQMVRKRGDAAGVPGLYPHKFRHTAASRWLGEGGTESGLMDHMGWNSRAMIDRYGRATRQERARIEARKHKLDTI